MSPPGRIYKGGEFEGSIIVRELNATNSLMLLHYSHDQCTQDLVHSVCHQSPGAAVLEQRTSVAPHASCLRNNIS